MGPLTRFRHSGTGALCGAAVLVASACSSGSGDTAQAPATPVPTVEAATTPAPNDQIPVVDAPLDLLVFDRLLDSGFSAAEADCLGRSLTIETMTSTAPEELVEAYSACMVDLERLIELSGSRPPATEDESAESEGDSSTQ